MLQNSHAASERARRQQGREDEVSVVTVEDRRRSSEEGSQSIPVDLTALPEYNAFRDMSPLNQGRRQVVVTPQNVADIRVARAQASRQTAAFREPSPVSGGAAPSAAQAAQLSQAEKDSRLVEFIHGVSEAVLDHYHEVDTESAVQFLEGAGWDVAAALQMFLAVAVMPDDQEDTRRQITVRPGDEGGVAHEAARLAFLVEQRWLSRGRTPRVDRRELVSILPERTQTNNRSAQNLTRRTREYLMELESQSADMVRAAMEDLRDQLNGISVMASQAAEADLDQAMRVSAQEAYSGGFAVAPADEARVAVLCRIKPFQAGACADETCPICLEDFADGDPTRSLPCGHAFHVGCIDSWLARCGQCPTCKALV